MRVKICGMTRSEQAEAVARLGATDLGFICVSASPRYITPEVGLAIADRLKATLDAPPNLIGVFANASLSDIVETVRAIGLTGVQLHGDESLEDCSALRSSLPSIELIKAFRVRDTSTLDLAKQYASTVDILLLDAYRPGTLGGTGHSFDWQLLQGFKPGCPWFLAGGLSPETIEAALSTYQPDGIDLSSGVERAPGDKDIDRVRLLVQKLQAINTPLVQ